VVAQKVGVENPRGRLRDLWVEEGDEAKRLAERRSHCRRHASYRWSRRGAWRAAIAARRLDHTRHITGLVCANSGVVEPIQHPETGAWHDAAPSTPADSAFGIRPAHHEGGDVDVGVIV